MRSNSPNVKRMRKWRRTPTGVVCSIWSNMVHNAKKPTCSTFGAELPAKSDFYEWALTHKDFNDIMEKWRESGYKRGMNPALVRICKAIGFVLTNLEWVTSDRQRMLAQRGRRF